MRSYVCQVQGQRLAMKENEKTGIEGGTVGGTDLERCRGAVDVSVVLSLFARSGSDVLSIGKQSSGGLEEEGAGKGKVKGRDD